MSNKKDKSISTLENSKVFCAYLDDNETKKQGYFNLVERGKTAVILKTKSGNILFIPIRRVLKIKQKNPENG